MDTHKASELIMQEVAAHGVADASGGGIPEDFCSLWPRMKPILDVVAGIVLLIPGLGATAGAVIKGFVKIGDEISQEMCK